MVEKNSGKPRKDWGPAETAEYNAFVSTVAAAGEAERLRPSESHYWAAGGPGTVSSPSIYK